MGAICSILYLLKICLTAFVYKTKHTSRTSAGNQPSGRRPPGFEEEAVALRGAFCVGFFQLFSFVGGQGASKDYMKEVSSSSGNFHIMKNFFQISEKKHLQILEFAISKKCRNF